MIGHDQGGLPARSISAVSSRTHPLAGDRRVGHGRQALPRHVVDDVQHPEAPAAGELVVHEVQRPAGVGAGLDQDRRAGADGTPAGLGAGAPASPPRGTAGRSGSAPPSRLAGAAGRRAAGSSRRRCPWVGILGAACARSSRSRCVAGSAAPSAPREAASSAVGHRAWPPAAAARSARIPGPSHRLHSDGPCGDSAFSI